jgi:hypothetical protein
MIQHFSTVRSRIESTSFFYEGRRLAAEGDLPISALPRSIPFAVEYPSYLHAALRVEIEFRAPLAKSERDAIFGALAIWDLLVEALGDKERWGETVNHDTRLLSPTIVEHEVNGYFASFECLHFIVWLGLRLNQRLTIDRLTME